MPEGKITSVEMAFQGPIPPPQVLKGYDQLIPGAADRILTMAENQSAHRRQMETKVVDGQIEDDRAERREARLGQVFALVIVVAAMVCAVLINWLNPGLSGGISSSVIGGGGLVSLVTVFILGRRAKSPEAEETPDEQ